MRGVRFGDCVGGLGRVRACGVAGLAVFLGVLLVAPVALALSPPQVYWAQGSTTIGVANLDGTGANQSFITGANFPVGVAVDGQRVYWANSGDATIGVANLNGTSANQSFITGMASPDGVAVNGQHIYWSNYFSDTIGVANLNGTGVNDSFITGANAPQGVAVDGRHIYWSNYLGNTIGVANLDGTAANQSFITGANNPAAVAVDGQHIYWANYGNGTIGEANLDGTDVNQSFITGATNPAGVAVDGQHIYWANGGSTTIGEANLNGTDVNQSFITGANQPDGVAVSVPVASVTPASPPAFAATPQGSVSGPRTLTLSNNGQRDLQVTGLTFTGADPDDFAITSDGCLGPVAPDESCRFTVRFVPGAGGVRKATLQIASNDYANSPLNVTLLGTGERAASATLVSLSKATLTYGSEQLEHFRATVTSQTAGTPTGKVTVRTGAVILCKITLASGKGSCSPHAKAIPAGKHTITAAYTGNINYEPSSSTGKTLTIKP